MKQEVNCFLVCLFCGETLTTEQMTVSVWEWILEAADTTVVTMEWAMYELAKDPKRQVIVSVIDT